MTASRRHGRPTKDSRTPREETAAQSWASSLAVRQRMQRQPTRNTAPELAVRRLLHSAGLRYRIDVAPLAGLRRRADVVFRSAKVAVFVDGCFWHGCPEHGQRATHANSTYWGHKVAKNQERDRDTDRHLEEAGWTSIRTWEHEEPVAVVARVIAAVKSRRAS